MAILDTCTTGCNADSHSSTCRSRQRRATDATRDHATSNDATPIDATATLCNADDATRQCNADATDPINWADPDKDYSTIARRTDGKVKVPGDPGYTGCCVEVDGKWVLRSSIPMASMLDAEWGNPNTCPHEPVVGVTEEPLMCRRCGASIKWQDNEINLVSLPGDPGYTGVAVL